MLILGGLVKLAVEVSFCFECIPSWNTTILIWVVLGSSDSLSSVCCNRFRWYYFFILEVQLVLLSSDFVILDASRYWWYFRTNVFDDLLQPWLIASSSLFFRLLLQLVQFFCYILNLGEIECEFYDLNHIEDFDCLLILSAWSLFWAVKFCVGMTPKVWWHLFLFFWCLCFHSCITAWVPT